MTKKICEYRCSECPLESCKVEGMTAKRRANRRAEEKAYAANPEAKLAKNRAWYEANKEKAAANVKRWREEHREEHNARVRAYRAEHREEYNAKAKERSCKQRGGAPRIPMTPEERKAVARKKNKAYRMANPEKERARKKAWYEANKEKVKAQQKAYRAAKSGKEVNDE